MYEPFYKLHPTPFRLTPDPHFFYESKTHKRGLAYLRYAFHQGEGFVVITGAPGTGKTELMMNLIEELPYHKVAIAKIVTTNLDADDFLDLVAASFQIDSGHVSKGSLLKKLEEYFARQTQNGKHVLLFVDEAHNLSVKSLIELTMLSNFQINEKPVLQCFLLGHHQLEDKINLPELAPLKQRIVASTRLDSLDKQETREYILHRLEKSGWDNNPVIHDEIFSFIYHYTSGIPRKINSLCNRLLLHSYLNNKHSIDADTVHLVVDELQNEAIEQPIDVDFTMLQNSSALTAPVNDCLSDASISFASLEQKNRHDSEHQHNDKQPLPQKPALGKRQQMAKTISSGKNKAVTATVDIPEFAKPGNDTLPGLAQKVANYNPARRATPQKNINVESAVHAEATHNSGRPSGLVDKELKFLLSLYETVKHVEQEHADQDNESFSTANTAAPEQEKQVSTSAPETTAAAVNTTKVIIDESVYDDYRLTNSQSDNEWDKSRTVTTSFLKNWKQITSVGIVIGSMIASISWFYNADTVPIDSLAKNQSQQIFNQGNATASVSPFSDDSPGARVSTSQDDKTRPMEDRAITKNTRAKSANLPENNATTASASMDIELPAIAATTTNTITGSANSSSSSDRKSSASELDKKTAQIMAKPDATNTTTTSGNRKSSTGQAATDKKANKPAPVKLNKPPAAVSKTIARSDRTIAPVVGSPLETSSSQHSTNITAGSTQSDSTGNSVAMHNNKTNVTVNQAGALISPKDLTTLLSRLSAAYETGNLQQLVSTFATDIYNKEGATRRQMLQEYQHLFNITDKRQLTIHDVTWSAIDKQMLGKGDFRVLVREKGATSFTRYQGKISFAVAKESDSIVIKKLDYDYGH